MIPEIPVEEGDEGLQGRLIRHGIRSLHGVQGRSDGGGEFATRKGKKGVVRKSRRREEGIGGDGGKKVDKEKQRGGRKEVEVAMEARREATMANGAADLQKGSCGEDDIKCLL